MKNGLLESFEVGGLLGLKRLKSADFLRQGIKLLHNLLLLHLLGDKSCVRVSPSDVHPKSDSGDGDDNQDEIVHKIISSFFF